MTENTDPRALRTREKLVSAFHDAITESDPRQMTVSALARAAGVNRTSFYEHFASPEDLAIHALSELFDVVSNADIALRSEHTVSGAEASRRALHEIVAFVGERRDSYARLLGPGAAPQLVRAVAEAFTERTVLALEPMDVRPPAADPRVTAQFLAGGVLGVVGAWLAGPAPATSPDQLVEALVQCLPGWLLDG
ncbi:MAG: TetR/AcrR family transcriptional regulator [Actinobacteria bacterium]|nr:TetR/AcrR family transcriptional regulator [Actinomycetota bacterium]